MPSLINHTRKVIALGSASFAVILPKEWVVDQHIEKGSDVLLFLQQNGQIIIQRSRQTKTRVVLDAGTLGDKFLDIAIQGSFILDVDETVAKFSEEDLLIDKINYLWDISKKFNGIDLAVSGPHAVTMNNLVNMGHLNINEILDQLLSICWLLLAQFEQKVIDKDNRCAIAQMEEKYYLGVRLLTFALHNQHLGSQTGMRDIIQVLGHRVVLLAMRSIIVQLHDVIPFLKSAEIPDLAIMLELFFKITKHAVQCLRETDIYLIEQFTEYWKALKVHVDKIEPAAGTIQNFFNNFLDLISSFKDIAITRYVDDLKIPCEE
jgi:hypothetical protein